MNKFKVGDIVKVVSGCHSFIEIGETYNVVKIEGQDIKLKGKNFPYHHSYFELVKSEFDMKTQPWFIRVNNEEEFNVVADFLEAEGFEFYIKKYEQTIPAISNTTLSGGINGENFVGRLIPRELEEVIRLGSKEIKINFKNTISIDNIEYPDVKSAQELEIEKIEEEMRKLADRLNKIKGEN